MDDQTAPDRTAEVQETDRQAGVLDQWKRRGRIVARLPSGLHVRVFPASTDNIILRGLVPAELFAMSERMRTGFRFNELKPAETTAFFRLAAIMAADCVKEIRNDDDGIWHDVDLEAEDFTELPDGDRTFLIRWAIGQLSKDDLTATLGDSARRDAEGG